MNKPEIETSYLQKIADWLCKQKEATYVSIKTLTDTPEKFIEACKQASEAYGIEITFTPDYSKVKKERVWALK